MKRLLPIIMFIMSLTSLHAQGYGFNAEVIGGLAAAQIRGDNIAGFNQPGVEAGIGASYGIRYNMDLGMELLYSQRGSRSELGFGNTNDIQYRLNYVSIPVLFYLRDWDFEDRQGYAYYKVNIHGGFSYGQLISSTIEGPTGTIDNEAFNEALNESDISWMLGMGVQITYRLGVRMRYNRSITKLFNADDHPSINSGDLLPYHLSFQLTYKLN